LFAPRQEIGTVALTNLGMARHAVSKAEQRLVAVQLEERSMELRAGRPQAAGGGPAPGQRPRGPEVCKQLEISEATYHRWRAQYGGLKADDARRLKELETENARLKRIVADKELRIEALKELGRGNW
jgi:putative transposase